MLVVLLLQLAGECRYPAAVETANQAVKHRVFLHLADGAPPPVQPAAAKACPSNRACDGPNGDAICCPEGSICR